MGSSVTKIKTGQLDSDSLAKARIQGIRIIDSGYSTLSKASNESTEYVLVLNRRNNYFIRQRTITENNPNPDFQIKQSFKSDANAAMKAWKEQKKEFDM